MKVDELRKIIAEFDPETTRKLTVELYKLIPKREREDSALDELIRAFSKTGKVVRKPNAEKDLITDFSVLETQAWQFIEYASLDYYYVPNRIVPKPARSKWRVTARKLIKSLIAVKGEHTEDAAFLLAEMYRMLGHACSYYIFSTEAPFSAVGFKQPDLLEIVLSKLFSNGFTQKTMRLAVYIVLESHVDRETLHTQLLFSLIRLLKTTDTRSAAREECAFFIKNFADPSARPYKSKRFLLTYDNKSWNIDRTSTVTENCTELYLRLSIALYEYDKGISFFKKHIHARDHEVNLYRLLAILYGYTEDNPEMVQVWIKVYDEAVAKGVSPRERLVERYHELIES
jgi:hypothetical protein